ncbi:sigma-E factor negative regulatory protein RseA [Gammaproteobacteria bacterium]
MATPKNEPSQVEVVSALMDGEVEADELDRIVREIAANPDLKDSWTRYHLTRDILHRTHPSLKISALPHRVAAALTSEPYYLRSQRRRFRPIVGFSWQKTGAIAAAVAILTLLAVLTFSSSPPSLTFPPQVATISSPTAVWIADEGTLLPTTEIWGSPVHPSAQLNPYLVDHGEYLPGSGIGNIIPFAHVSYGE